MYNEQRKKHGQTREAITETIRICKDRNVLKEYLESKEQEVVDIMMTLFDDDYILEAYAKEREDNAAHREARKTAERMIRMGKGELRELEAEVMQLA